LLKEHENNKRSLFTLNYAAFGDLLFRMSFRSKKYAGNLYKKTKAIKNVLFYDEREWRYIPTISELVSHGVPISYNEKEFKDNKTYNKHNKELTKHCKLSFEPKDIKYIIVRNDKEILRMMSLIDEIKRKYTTTEKMLLKSRLITIKHVMEDF